MKVIGITRVRNESGLIQNTLDHVSNYVDDVHVFDDASQDSTPSICEAHSTVKKVIRNDTWLMSPKDRILAEGYRQQVYETAVRAGADYVYVFDADEFIEPTDKSGFNIDPEVDAYYFKLFDFYITEGDKDRPYWSRQYMGPEYRGIPMLFKVSSKLNFTQRVPRGIGPNIVFGGYVKHYGKAMSVEQWEADCDYYANVRWNNGKQQALRQRWMDRKGKAIHTESDFGRPLITWEERENTSKIVKI